MKRFIVCLISMLLLLFSLSACGEQTRDAELKDKLKANEDSLEETFTAESTTFKLFNDYIKSWAKNNDIEITKTNKNYIILSNPASESSKDETSTTLICNVDTDDIQSYLPVISTASTSLLGSEKHGDIRLIFSELRDGRYLGTEKVPMKYLECDNLINMQTASDDVILTSGSYSATSKFSVEGSKVDTAYTEAYEIKMSMAEYTDPFDFSKDKNYPNPINIIGSLLATEKSSGKLFDIASFSYQAHEGYTPYSAKAVVVIDSNNVESFTNKFNKSYENAQEKFDKIEDDFVYTITETDMPQNVLSDDVSDYLISLMYTLNTGICNQDEESGIVYSTSYIDSISTKSGNLNLTIKTRARNKESLDELLSEYEITAGLSSSEYESEKTGMVWTSDPDSKLVKFFTKAVPLNEDSSPISIRSYETDVIEKNNPDQNMIIYSFKKGNSENVVLNIAHFMDPDFK